METLLGKDAAYGTGFFIEFGARDGIEHSNTYFFEKQMGWRGLLLEAVHAEQKNISQNRAGAAVLDGGVCQEDGMIEFAAAEVAGWSGRLDTYDANRKDTLRYSRVRAACFSLKNLTELFGIRRVDYMSVDTEGSELDALKGFPWGTVHARVVGVEILTGDVQRVQKEQAIHIFMKSVGYVIAHELQFAGDTKDVFYRPLRPPMHHVHRNDYAHFARAKELCVRFLRCL